MSEYNKFIKQYNDNKNQSDPGVSPPGDSDTAAGTLSADGNENVNNTEAVKPEKPLSHFIKNSGASFVSVNGTRDNEADGIEKYSDRLKQKSAPKKKHTGYTGKLNTYAANHAPNTEGPKFKQISESEKMEHASVPSKKDTPERSAVAQTRIVPEVIDPEKRPEPVKTPEKKEVHDFFDITSDDADVKTDTPVQETVKAEKPADAANIIKQPEEIKTAEENRPKEASHEEHEDDFSDDSEKADGKTKRIIASKSSLLRKLAKTSTDLGSADYPEDLPGEEELEEEVLVNRQKRINDFNFWSKTHKESGTSEDQKYTLVREKKSLPEHIGAFAARFEGFDGNLLKVKCDPFRDFNHHRPVFRALIGLRKSALIKAAIIAGLGLIMLIMNIVTASSAASNNGFFTVFGGSAPVYVTVNLVFMIIAAVLMADDLSSGLFSFLQARPGTDSALLFMVISALIQIISSYGTKLNIENNYHMLTGCVILLCAPLLVSKSFYYDNIRHCFKTVATKSEKSYLRRVNDPSLTASLLSDTNNEGKNVVYAGKTRFIADFIERSRTSAEAGQIPAKFTLIAIGVSVIIGIIGIIVKQSFLFGLSTMTIAAALSFPVGSLFFTGFMLSNVNKNLSLKGAFINSYDDANDLVAVDNLIIDASDAFKAKITGASTYGGASEKQAAFVAAALTNASGGILSKPFFALSGIEEAKFPEAEDLTYEEKMGFSAWISGCKVLLGSKTFLENHNVNLPEKEEAEGEKYIYLALAGHAAAKFTVKYTCKNEAARRLRMLADNGTNILLMTSDPNITDAYAEKLLALPADSVKVINRKAAQKIADEQETITDGETAGVVFSDNFDSLSRCTCSAVKLNNAGKLSKIICEITTFAGLALALMFAVSGSAVLTACWTPVLIQLLWIALCFLLPPLFSPSRGEDMKISAVRPVSVQKPYTPDNYVAPERKKPVQEEPVAEMPVKPAVPEVKEEIPEEEIYEEEIREEVQPDTYQLPVMDDFSGFSLKGSSRPAQTRRQAPEPAPRRQSRNPVASFGNVMKRNSQQPARNYNRAPREEMPADFDDMGDDMRFRTSSASSVRIQEPETRKAAPRRSILSFAEEKLPEPPKYNLDEKDDMDFLNVKFEPPVDDMTPSGTVFDDEYFSRYDDSENIFAGLKDQQSKTFRF